MKFWDKFVLGYWNIGIIENDISDVMEKKEYRIRWMKHPYRDRFFADPFIYEVTDSSYIVLAEEYIFYYKKGTIVKLEIDKKSMKLKKRSVFINDNTHLSFPYIYKGYIAPENYRSGGYYAYRFNEGTNSFDKYLIDEVPLIDPIIFEYEGNTWVFGSRVEHSMDQVELFLYDRCEKQLKAHRQNPVCTLLDRARCAGRIFEYQGNYFRPVQNCIGQYGKSVKIAQILCLSELEYKEKVVLEIKADVFPPYNEGIHTFNCDKGVIVVDGFMKKRRFIRAVLYKKFYKIMCTMRKSYLENRIVIDEKENVKD